MTMKIKERDLEYIFSRLSNAERRKFSGTKILLTGCAGFLGYYMLSFFSRFRDELGIRHVVGLDNFRLGRPLWIEKMRADSKIEIIDFDILKKGTEEIPSAQEMDYVFHMASIASPVYYREYPIETLDANVWGLRKLLDFYSGKDLRGFLFYSSSEVYGNPDQGSIPTHEEYFGNVSSIGPRACYDEAKRVGETLCYLYHKKRNLPARIVRPFNNYGPGMSLKDGRLPADLAGSVYFNRDIIMFSDGKPTRTFCYISDAIVGYLKTLLHEKFDYFNIGMDKPEISVREMAEIYAEVGKKLFSYTGRIFFEKHPDAEYLSNNPSRRCPDISKAKKELGYDPSILVEDGVMRFLQFLKEEKEEAVQW